MRDFILVFCAALFASVLTYAIADHAAKAQAHTAQVVTDEEGGAVRVLIDGKDIARFDARGLHVDGLVTSRNSFVLPVVNEPAIVPGGKGGSAR